MYKYINIYVFFFAFRYRNFAYRKCKYSSNVPVDGFHLIQYLGWACLKIVTQAEQGKFLELQYLIQATSLSQHIVWCRPDIVYHVVLHADRLGVFAEVVLLMNC